LGVDVEALKRRTRYYLEKIPTIITPQTFGQFYLTQDMAKVLDVARQEMRKMGDEYISVEHLFLALLSTDTKAREVLEEARFIQGGGISAIEFGRLDYQTFLKEVMKIRGGQKVTDVEPETKYQVIEKYAVNLTTLAKQGKIRSCNRKGRGNKKSNGNFDKEEKEQSCFNWGSWGWKNCDS
jgi:ATP-dependent Clp protease ATP-binding subunit ClpA